MRYKKINFCGFYLGGLAHESEAVAELSEFAGKEKINSGYFTIIGAVKEAVISFYDQKEKKYVEKKLATPMEIVSCIGNVARKDGEIVIHAHACFSLPNGSSVGGHLVSMKIFAGELHLWKSDERVERKLDSTTGLNLFDIKNHRS